jgi:THO complex subunit 4
VSNLPQDVNEEQIKVYIFQIISSVFSHSVMFQELFHTQIGPLREVTLHYDSNGRSKGVAAVHFQRRGDGNKACKEFNDKLIDGS